MGIAHLAVDLRLGHQGRHGVHDDNVHRTGAHHGLGDLQRLLAVIRLGDVEIIHVHADISRIDRIQRVLCVDESGDTALLLHLSYHVKRHGGLTAGLRAIDLDDPSPRNAAQSQGDIQAQGAGGDGLYIHIRGGIAQLHHGALAVGLLDLGQRRIQCF